MWFSLVKRTAEKHGKSVSDGQALLVATILECCDQQGRLKMMSVLDSGFSAAMAAFGIRVSDHYLETPPHLVKAPVEERVNGTRLIVVNISEGQAARVCASLAIRGTSLVIDKYIEDTRTAYIRMVVDRSVLDDLYEDAVLGFF